MVIKMVKCRIIYSTAIHILFPLPAINLLNRFTGEGGCQDMISNVCFILYNIEKNSNSKKERLGLNMTMLNKG